MKQLIKSIEIPNFNEESGGFKYYILTEASLNYYTDFIKVPNQDGCITKIMVAPCWVESLITYRNTVGELLTVPNHDPFCGYPIFTNMQDAYMPDINEDDEKYSYFFCTHKYWMCPQNFFLTQSSAQQMLDYIKIKCGTITQEQFETDNFNVISSFGKFNELRSRSYEYN